MVHFVGAGCGAVDLITVRGKRLIEEADLIIYAGSLINKELLSYAKRDCELHDSAYMTLDEVIQVIKKAHQKPKTIVRLHSGDPSIYGAIKEQMDCLNDLNISYDVCPGVSAFCGAASSLKVEYTLPNVSQTVIISRMSGKTKVLEKESLRSLAAHKASMILFLSTGLLEESVAELLLGGYLPTDPAAIVYKATWEDEIIIRCTIAELPHKAKENQITKTALIMIGGFLDSDYELSKLYSSDFSTQFRQATVKNYEK